MLSRSEPNMNLAPLDRIDTTEPTTNVAEVNGDVLQASIPLFGER
jgi:hypothetical protein